jgi:photosystem II stability/assembly factor-like uncharacterized protein
MQQIELCCARARAKKLMELCAKSPVVFLFAYLLWISAPASADGLQKLSFRTKIFDLLIRGDEMFVTGFPGIGLHSKDKGASFEALDVGTDDAIFAIDVASDGTGAFVSRNGVVATTADGGKMWTKRETGTKEHLFSVAVAPGGKIWAVGHFGVIVHSGDGGKSFNIQKYDAVLPPLPKGETESPEEASKYAAEAENEGSVEEARLNAVTFADGQKGWIAGEFGLVLHTEDGGATWKRQRSNVGKLMFAIHAKDDKNLIAVGSEGIFIETLDGGVHWKEVATGVEEHLLGVWPVGERCFAVGRDGLIIVRDKPQDSFRRIPIKFFGWLGSVVFLNEKQGYIAGARGFFAKTVDGGATWAPLMAK